MTELDTSMNLEVVGAIDQIKHDIELGSEITKLSKELCAQADVILLNKGGLEWEGRKWANYFSREMTATRPIPFHHNESRYVMLATRVFPDSGDQMQRGSKLVELSDKQVGRLVSEPRQISVFMDEIARDKADRDKVFTFAELGNVMNPDVVIPGVPNPNIDLLRAVGVILDFVDESTQS